MAWSYAGSTPCPGGVETCYSVHSVSVAVDSGASVTSSHSWSSGVLAVSATVSSRLGPVSVTYTVVVKQYEEQTIDAGTDNPYQARVEVSTSSMSVSAAILVLPTGVSVLTQPSSAYTAASTTAVAVTLRLSPAVPLTGGHPFSAEMVAVSESGACARCNFWYCV